MKKSGNAPPWLAKAAARKVSAHKKKHHGKVKPNAKAPVGSGGRFAALVDKLEGEKGKNDVKDPKALAAAIGRRKYGASKFAAMGKK